MPNPLALIGDSVKAVAPRISRLAFASTGGNGFSWQNVGFMPNGLTQGAYIGGGEGANYDWDKLVADPMQNTVVAAVVDAYARALPEAPLTLEKFDGPQKTGGSGGEWQRVEQHEALDLFNPDSKTALSEAEVWGVTGAHKLTRGESYWYLAMNTARTRPVEIWPYLPERVRVEGDETNFISGYKLQDGKGEWQDVSSDQVIHFRHLPSLYDYRHGWTPLSTGRSQMVGDNAVSTYHAAILLNAGVMSLLVSIKQSTAQGAASTVTPGDFDAMLDRLRRKYIGNKAAAGDIDGLNLPLDIQKMGYSPDEMAVDKLLSYYETRLCTLMGVDPMVTGLGSGTTTKTYANFGEAINDFWERRIVPDRKKDASTLNRQLLPLFFEGEERRNWRYGFDFSQVAALQENADQLFTRWTSAFEKGVADLYTASVKIGLTDVPDDYKGRFAKPTVTFDQAPALPPASDPATAQGGQTQ